MPRTRDFPLPNALRLPIQQTATYFFANSAEIIAFHEGEKRFGRYARYDNPNWRQVEQAYAALEGVDAALVFPSGMSAIWTTLISFLKSGDNLAYYKNGYRNTRNLCEQILAPLEIRALPLSVHSQEAFESSLVKLRSAGCRVLFLESPTNPHLYMVNFDLAKRILGPDVIIIVDSTLSSPMNFNPTQYGADLVIHSGSKYIGGHHDLISGFVGGNNDLIDCVRNTRNITGPITSSEICSLLYRSIETLPLRMEKLNKAGMELANELEKRSKISRVYYTGLPSHPSYNQAAFLLCGHGSVVSFELNATLQQTSKFVDLLEVPFMGTNFGGAQSIVEQCAVFTYFNHSPAERKALDIADSLVRYSVGFEPIQIVLDDIDLALDRI